MTTTNRPPQRTSRSRLSMATAAVRPGMPGKMLLAGPSGAGKTYTALLVATALCPEGKRIVGIDTEKDSMRTYADEFKFDHLPWAAPFNATDLELTIKEADEDDTIGVIIVDSFTHFWRGQGGILDTASGKWTGWNEARPMHADVIDAILSSSKHVILCARMKQQHEQVEENGRKVVRKLGMGIQQDDNIEYEVNVAIEMDMAHTMFVSKSRTRAVPVGTEFISGHAERFAGTYRDWLAGGEPVISHAQRDALVEVLNRISDAPARQVAKDAFLSTFGRPEFILESRFAEATEWVADRLLGVDETPDRAEDDAPADETATAHETHEHGEEPPANVTWCRGCGHSVEVHEIDGKCLGIIAGDNSSNVPDLRCDCEAFVEDGPSDNDSGTDSERRGRIEDEVTQLGPRELADALKAAKRSPNGSVKQQRKRLVDARMKVPQTADESA